MKVEGLFLVPSSFILANNTMRLFVGVELDEALHAACAAAARELQERLRHARVNLAARWVPEHNLHTTLWFLGNVGEAQAAAIVEALRSDWDIASFSIGVSGAGCFPPSGPPRIVWLGVSGGAECLTELHRELADRLLPLGFEPERRPYHPHVTIARVKDADRTISHKVRAILEAADPRPGSGDVRSVTLFQSHVSSAGARYVPLLRVPLKEC
jgi:RNA 2',3'-cyclic 3'-phosphodiesterase